MKRSLLLAIVLALVLSCTGIGATTAALADDIYEVVIQFPTLGTTPQDLQMVEDAINVRTEAEIGVHVTFEPATAFDLSNTTNLMISSGDKLDLAMCMFEGGVGNYVNKGAIIELDELVAEYGQDIVAAEGQAMSGGYFNGNLYGIPSEEKMGRVRAFFAREDLLEKYGIENDPTHVYTYEELSAIFETVQAGEGKSFHCVAINSNEDMPFTYMNPVDHLGSSLASGCLENYGIGTTTITNLYESEAFAAYCEIARDWYGKGYFAPDCNTNTDSALIQWQSGQYLGMFASAEPDMILNYNLAMQAYFGCDAVPMYVSEPAAMTQFYQSTLWMIPITCDNPEKTMQFLNLMYKDNEIINLLYRGIEGVHYNFQDGSDCVISYPEGIDNSNTPYSAILNVWGDKSKQYVMVPSDASYYTDLAAFNASISKESEVLGYCFNSDPVKAQLAGVNSVISEYLASLSLGVVDPATELPEFISALKAAGIDEVIAENQSQYDTWRQAQ
ncbi:MAG: ABC transporter substrate-binding protein [Clostridiales bacterium]|nr:ABC transporter substrate-binding protein [Clostridiales bacterium]